MKITESLIIGLLKHGILGEMKNFKTEIMIPGETETDPPRKISITADTLLIRMEREGR